VARHLATLIPGDAAHEFVGETGDRLLHGVVDFVRLPAVGQVQQDQEATSRDTVDTARPIEQAIAVNVSPRSTPARISSRSLTDKRATDGFQSDADGGPRFSDQDCC
jgi:hypothetical protein